jgi:hypothetical protein
MNTTFILGKTKLELRELWRFAPFQTHRTSGRHIAQEYIAVPASTTVGKDSDDFPDTLHTASEHPKTRTGK